MKLFLRAATAVTCVSLSACATVTRGPSTDWQVRTNPPGASVQTSNGKSCAATPCTFRMSRKASFTATVTKPGYQPVQVKVDHGMSTAGVIALSGNVILGGVPGIVVDVVTGAPNDLQPRSASLALKPDATQALAEAEPAPTAEAQPAPAAQAQPVAYAPEPSATSVAASRPLAPAPHKRQGRVVELKLMPDGSVVEVHAPTD